MIWNFSLGLLIFLLNCSSSNPYASKAVNDDIVVDNYSKPAIKKVKNLRILNKFFFTQMLFSDDFAVISSPFVSMLLSMALLLFFFQKKTWQSYPKSYGKFLAQLKNCFFVCVIYVYHELILWLYLLNDNDL